MNKTNITLKRGYDIINAQQDGVDLQKFVAECPRIPEPAQDKISPEEYSEFNKKLDEKRATENSDVLLDRETTLKILQQPVSLNRPIKYWTAESLLTADFPDPTYLIPDILPEGVTLLAGAPKIGKSWLCLDIAVTLAHGGTILGNKVVIPTRTLYVSLEDTARRLKSRLRKQCSAPINKHTIVTEWDKGSEAMFSLVAHMHTYPDTKLIIIDTLSKFATIKDGNDYQETTAIITGLKNFAEKFNVSILLVHHAKKAETEDFIHAAVGSVGLTGAVDTILILQKKRTEYTAKLSISGRDIEEQQLALSFDPFVCRWSIMGNAADIADSKERQDIIDLLKNSTEPMKVKEISQILNKNYGSVKFLLIKMAEVGQITRQSRGEYISNTATHATNTTHATHATHATQEQELEFG